VNSWCPAPLQPFVTHSQVGHIGYTTNRHEFAAGIVTYVRAFNPLTVMIFLQPFLVTGGVKLPPPSLSQVLVQLLTKFQHTHIFAGARLNGDCIPTLTTKTSAPVSRQSPETEPWLANYSWLIVQHQKWFEFLFSGRHLGFAAENNFQR